MNKDQIIEIILNAKNIVFLTGAGVSTLSGIPDYRSMQGVYHNIENPEYLLSHTCFVNEPGKFYNFVKELYHPQAQPNIIHQTIAELENNRDVITITQNIDGLHSKAGSSKVLEFHGNLYNLYCTKCHEKIDVERYLKDYHHDKDQGIIRPKVVLYEEMLNNSIIDGSIIALEKADVVVVVGTSLKVYPFASLLNYIDQESKIIIINKDEIQHSRADYTYFKDAQDIFKSLDNKLKKQTK